MKQQQQQQQILLNNNKRTRDLNSNNSNNEYEECNQKLRKIPNIGRSKTNDFQCQVYFQKQVFDFRLSQIFNQARFAVLFFCASDFTSQSKSDMEQIQANYSRFIEYGALPIAISHDRAQVHWAYATPQKTTTSLSFEPSFVLASDSIDRLISTSFKSIDFNTFEMKRSVVIIDSNMNIIFTHYVSPNRFFPITLILNCFDSNYLN